MSSGCRTDVAVVALHYDRLQAADAGFVRLLECTGEDLAAALDGNDRRPSNLGAMEVGHDDGNLQSIIGCKGKIGGEPRSAPKLAAQEFS